MPDVDERAFAAKLLDQRRLLDVGARDFLATREQQSRDCTHSASADPYEMGHGRLASPPVAARPSRKLRTRRTIIAAASAGASAAAHFAIASIRSGTSASLRA